MTRALGALAMLVVVVAGCAAPAASTTPDPASSTAAPSASPIATPAPVPPTTAPSPRSPGPSASPWTGSTDTLAWHRLGVIPVTGVNGLVGFDEGYVALEGTTGSVWFSAHGASWKNVKLPFKGDRSKATDANGLLGRAIATNGREVLVVGGYSHTPCSLTEPGSTGGGPDCSISPIAWISDDGVAWRRADLSGADGEFVAVWPVAEGGWSAALSGWYGESLGGDELWRSTDGITWKPVAPKPPAAWEGYDHAPQVISSGSGPYLLASNERGGSETTLAMTDDGKSWRVLKGFPGTGTEVFAGSAPAAGRTRWVLGGQSGCGEDGCGGGPTIWSSSDGERWTATVLPVGPGVSGADTDMPVVVTAVTSLVLSERGYVAVGVDASWSEGARHETWVSDEGVTWKELPGGDRSQFDFGPGLVAAGPGGVIGISGSRTAGESVVWQLR